VPFCKRTTGKGEPGDEMICRVHGMMVSKRTRKIWSHFRRKANREMQRDPGSCTLAEIDYVLRLSKIAGRTWQKFKSEAIEAAGGLR
jgi:hypothetical protein